MSWNFVHIVNPRIRVAIERLNTAWGIATPVICTPEELMEVQDEG